MQDNKKAAKICNDYVLGKFNVTQNMRLKCNVKYRKYRRNSY